MKKALLLVLDGFGIGEAPDANSFGDETADTLGHLVEAFPQLNIPHLASLGLNRLKKMNLTTTELKGQKKFARLQELSAGKDTTTGHWEMMGALLEKNFDVFPSGFPKDFLEAFCKEAKLDGVIGNKPASGTEIIEELGEEHLSSKKPILYTSADSVLQLAVHEEAFGRERLYEICRVARKLLDESSWEVGRVIARPFLGASSKDFQRTEYRKDFSLPPPPNLFLDRLKASGKDVIGVGKVPSIYADRGFTKSLDGKTDKEGLESVFGLWQKGFEGLCFVNLNELDSLYAHRRNPEGYKNHLEWIDTKIGKFIGSMREGELLLITADHGNDPHFAGSDHTREFVPLLSFQKGDEAMESLGTKRGFYFIAQSLSDYFEMEASWHKESLFA